MNTIKEAGTQERFAALKLVEQAFLDNQIPGHVFRNILKDYGDDIDVTAFLCVRNNKEDFAKCME